MRTPRIRNGYLHFGRKIKQRKTKRRRGTKRKRQKGGGFFCHILASAIATVATNLLNGIARKILVCAQSEKRKRRKTTKNRRNREEESYSVI